MPTVQREITIRCSPEEFLGFVMDIERYAEVDDKLGSFDWVRREENFLEFRLRPILPGVPGPAPRMTAQGRLTRMLTFAASFAFDRVEEGTLVRRTFGVELRPAFGWLLEPILRRSLPADIENELRQAKRYLELPG